MCRLVPRHVSKVGVVACGRLRIDNRNASVPRVFIVEIFGNQALAPRIVRVRRASTSPIPKRVVSLFISLNEEKIARIVLERCKGRIGARASSSHCANRCVERGAIDFN
jgi:hypothetical protein